MLRALLPTSHPVRTRIAAMSTLYLVRHGQASFGSEDYDRLSQTGVQQVEWLRDHWQTIDERLDAIYAGRLRRQRHTAEILAAPAGSAVTTLAQFDEYDADRLLRHAAESGQLQHVTTEMLMSRRFDARSFQRELEATGLAWIDGRLHAAGGESWREFRTRVGDGLRELVRREGRARRIAVCTSAGVIGAAVGEVLGLSDHETIKLSWAVHNSSVTRLHYDDRRLSLSAFNIVPHLEHPQRRALVTFR
jgi:broad specificity phosphatase PhoE